jgi:hypothetical protein
VTLFQVYEDVISRDKLRARIAQGERQLTANTRRVVVDTREHLFSDVLTARTWHP